MKLRTLAAAGLAVALLHAPARAQESEGSGGSGLPPIPDVPETMTVDDAIAARDRAIGFLVASQNPDGSWGSASNELFAEAGFSVETYYAWKGASHGLAMMALQSAPETPERRAALDKAIDWFLEMRIPQRGSDWDVDYSWTAQYCFVAATRLATDPRFSTGERGEKIAERGKAYWALLERLEVPSGGWAYYDDPPFASRPSWATSFCTAAVTPAVKAGVELGWIEDPGHLDRCLRVLRRASLPNGAYSYNGSDPIPRSPAGESIDNVKGSLGRIQVCNWARYSIGDPEVDLDRLRWGLDRFLEFHKFLDVARMRPVPHEAYYANAGYFYMFAHYYACETIQLLPEDEREAYYAKVRPHLIKCQRKDGSSCDFLGSSYNVIAGTSYTALALGLGIQRD